MWIRERSKDAKMLLDALVKKNEVSIVNLSKQSLKNGASSLNRVREISKILKSVWRNRKNKDLIYLSLAESFAGNMRDLFIYRMCQKDLKKTYIPVSYTHLDVYKRQIMHLPADDLAAVQVENQVKVEPAPRDLCRQVGHVPAPNLAHGGSDVRGRRPDRLGCLGAPTVSGLPMRAQDAAEGGFAGQIDPFIGQHGHDARRRHGGKARRIGEGQHLGALGLREGMGLSLIHI